MKRIHPERWRSQSFTCGLRSRPRFCAAQDRSSRARAHEILTARCQYHHQPHNHERFATPPRRTYSTAVVAEASEPISTDDRPWSRLENLPSPPISNSLQSAKLSALHARLGLPRSLPLQTLARCLIHITADNDPSFNNSSLALLGSDILGYHTSEHLLCNYPRLPISVIFAAQNAYVGSRALADIVRDWGVEVAAEPGGEVDPGLLQFRRTPPGGSTPATQRIFESDTSRINKENAWALGAKRGMGVRIVADDQFGDFGRLLSRPSWQSQTSKQTGTLSKPDDAETVLSTPKPGALTQSPSSLTTPDLESTSISALPLTTDLETAGATFVRAVVGAIALHNSRAAAKQFHTQHILSRHLDLAPLFIFRYPTRDLSRLCAREGFENPVARLLSETGRHSIAPVFIVGVFSGADKLGEGAGSSLDEARTRAAANALRSWYLYRPAEVVKPSDVEDEQTKKRWTRNYVDCGEVVT